MFFMWGVYFSGGSNSEGKYGFYDRRYFMFERSLKCPRCKKSFPPEALSSIVVNEVYESGVKPVNVCMCPYGCQVCVGTDIRYYKMMGENK